MYIQTMKLFSKLELPRKNLKNRVIAALPNSFLTDSDGCLTTKNVDFHQRIAEADPALVITEPVSISKERFFAKQPYLNSSDAQIRLSSLAKAVRKAGSIPVLSIFHPGFNSFPKYSGMKFYGPSEIFIEYLNRQVQAFTYEQIGKIVTNFLEAAINAWNTGFSGIEISGADGTLVQQFLSPLFNKRIDSYGHSTNQGQKIAIEIVQAIRKAMPDFFLIFKISCRDLLPGGKPIKETADLARKLEEAGADLLHITSGFKMHMPDYESPVGKLAPPATFAAECQFLKNQLNIPVALSGKIDTPDLAEELIRNKVTDAVSLGCALLRDLDWLSKARMQSENVKIRKCKRCLVCSAPAYGCPDCKGIIFWKLQKTK
jgi:2,4-dienoyl-CoA reductase (NADPH2)